MKWRPIVAPALGVAVLLGASACDKQPDLAQVEELESLRTENASLRDQLGQMQEQKEAAAEKMEQAKKEIASLKVQMQSFVAEADQARLKANALRAQDSDQTDTMQQEQNRLRRRNLELEDSLRKSQQDLLDALRARAPSPKLPAIETPALPTAPATRE